MGLSKAALRFLAIEHRRKPFRGDALTLGRQCVYATFGDVQGMLRKEQIEPASLPAGVDTKTNIPSWKGTSYEHFTSDVAFFQLLGVPNLRALDVDSFETAEIIWDLNKPIDSELSTRFDLIVDSGTIEHIFDVRTAMTNLVKMLRPGGRIVHMTPANNFCNHGFFQFSPTCFADFYAVNQFRDVRVFVAEETQRFERTRRLDLFELDASHQPAMMASSSTRRLLSICVAEKGSKSMEVQVPTQSYYSAIFAASATAPASESAERVPTVRISRLANRLLPAAVYSGLRSSWIFARRSLFGGAAVRRPWGLKFWKRLE